MSNYRRRFSLFSFLYTVFIFVLIAVLACSVVFFYRYTNGFADEFKTLYVAYDGYVFSTDDEIILARGGEYSFKVGNSLSFLIDDDFDYTVYIVPNITAETNFEYTVDDETYTYEKLYYDYDITSAFNVQITDSGFTFETPRTMFSLLSSVYGSTDIDISADGWDIVPGWDKTAYFSIIVSAYGGSSDLIELYGSSVVSIDLYLCGNVDYEISFDQSGFFFDNVDCAYTAYVGDKVTFTADVSSTVTIDGEVYDVFLCAVNADRNKSLGIFGINSGFNVSGNSYTFTMPECNVFIQAIIFLGVSDIHELDQIYVLYYDANDGISYYPIIYIPPETI